jgi:DNA-binding NarL/FixJ family response regulator
VNGDYYYPEKFKNKVKAWLDDGLKKKIPAIHFSEREMDLILKLSRGHTNKQIGIDWGISQRTVEEYRHELIRKTQVKNTAELLEFIYGNGIARPS